MAKIVLENEVIQCKSFGASGIRVGEIVFNTGMTGYQEVLTDPSYAGQIVTFTYPLIGNYGINGQDFESNRSQVQAIIVKAFSGSPNHYQMEQDLNHYLKDQGIIGICGLDTRRLTKQIREKGVMNGVVCTDDDHPEAELRDLLNDYVFPSDILSQVSCKQSYVIKNEQAELDVGVIDTGIKRGILQHMVKAGARLTVYPYDIRFEQLAKHDMIFFSNGPGDPKAAQSAIQLAQQLRGTCPLRGICLGHQILALSLGADTYKLKFGHRGSNHPVIHRSTNKVYITSQNHGYSVSPDSISEDMTISYTNVNDNTVEGIQSLKHNIKSVQFHPEEGPGPSDTTHIIYQWIQEIISERRNHAVR